jgi:NAD(P)-dependent dehydrogenase (short-subunit alcohol dehydrogenase family)
MTLAGKVALVTGASRGIGKAIAQKCLEEGANLIITARNEHLLRAVAEEYEGRVLVLAGDIADAGFRRQLVEKAIARFGHLDCFIPAAGVVQFVSLAETSVDVMNFHFNTNFFAVVELTRLVVPYFRDKGSIIYVSSSITSGGFPGLAAYSASKGALEAYMRTAAVELAKPGQDIIVNTIAPGPTQTEMWSSALPPETLAQVAAMISPRLLTKQFGEPAHIADLVVALAHIPTIRGQRIVVDAGYGIH